MPGAAFPGAERGSCTAAPRRARSRDQAGDDSRLVEEVEGARDLKFGLERDMQVALRENIEQLDPTMRIVDGGTKRHAATGRTDILAEDQGGSLIVIELKADEARDSALTQVLGYVGALRRRKAETMYAAS